jgi:uncharacterized SAM-binding protein YcdF (DUF218 family)
VTEPADRGDQPPPQQRKPTTLSTWRRVLVAVAVVAFSALTVRLFVWPDLPPLPEHADAIVQLGGPGNRRSVALNLARDGRAPVVAISVSDDEINTSWCEEGRLWDVPVICFKPDPYSTRGEARWIADAAQQYGWHSVILVATKDQAWRASVRVRRCFDGSLAVATARLPIYLWPVQVSYQWVATAKAYTYETAC